MKKLIWTTLVCLASFTISAASPDSVEVAALDPLFSEEKPTLTKAHEGVPKEMEPIIDSALRASGELRQPASTGQTPKVDGRSLASTVGEGFEFKVKQGSRVTAFWLKKNGDQFDLVFATNGGSRATSSIPVEHFAQLTAVAGALRAPASDITKCKDAYARLVVVSEGKEARPIMACLDAKGKKAEQIRRFGSALVAYVK